MSLSHRMELSRPRQCVMVLGQPHAHHIMDFTLNEPTVIQMLPHSSFCEVVVVIIAILEPIVSAAQLISHQIRMNYHVAWCKNPHTGKEQNYQ